MNAGILCVMQASFPSSVHSVASGWQWIGKDLEGSSHGIIIGTTLATTWRQWEEPRKSSVWLITTSNQAPLNISEALLSNPHSLTQIPFLLSSIIKLSLCQSLAVKDGMYPTAVSSNMVRETDSCFMTALSHHWMRRLNELQGYTS